MTSETSWVASQSQEVAAASGPSLVNQMIEQETLTSAATWLEKNATTPAFDRSIATFAYQAFDQNKGELAADWVMQIENEERRAQIFQHNLDEWIESDRTGALKYIENNPVPQSIKDLAREIIEEG